MKKLNNKTIAVVICIISIVIFGAYIGYKKINKDITPPSIEFQKEEIHRNILDDENTLLEDVKATDKEEGDVTDSIVLENIEKTSKGENNFDVSYAAFDQAGNYSVATRNLIFDDYTSPHFTIDKQLRFSSSKAIYLKNYIKASDCFGTDLTPYITMDGIDEISNGQAAVGNYTMNLKVENSMGDKVELPVNVEIYDDTLISESFRPTIVLSQYVVYIKKGKRFRWISYIKYIEDGETLLVDTGKMIDTVVNGEIVKVTQAVVDGKKGNWINYSQIHFKTNLDINTPGVYTGIYSYTSKTKDIDTNCKLVIVVE